MCSQMFERSRGRRWIEIFGSHTEHPPQRPVVPGNRGEHGGRALRDASEKLAMRVRIERRVENRQGQPENSVVILNRCLYRDFKNACN